ncbi:MAG: hypothetical protein GY711_31845 [bacterium]|nr:hypothetical protein [bacterium]
MKLLGNLLLTVSLVLGMISAATAYFGFVSSDSDFSEDGELARLKAPAGAIPLTQADLDTLRQRYDAGELTAEAYTAARKEVKPVVSETTDEGGTRLGSETVAQLAGADVKTVFTKSFSFGRWRFWWVFLLSAIGLFAGSMMVRRAAEEEIAAAAAAGGAHEDHVTPPQAISGLLETLRTLRDELGGMDEESERLSAILARVSEVQKRYIGPFIDARPLLVGQKGLGGYAELMDRFAAAERQLNRAWSAAADGVLEESVDCLARAEELFELTQESV